MKWKDMLDEWGLTSLKLSAGFLNAEWKPQDPDKDAAWELYVELLTRITTQPLPNAHGVERTALDSVYSLFPTTRAVLKTHGRKCAQFTKLAVIVLNQIVRPFTAEWHRIAEQGGFDDPATCARFRAELQTLQQRLVVYSNALAKIADVEDLTGLISEG